MSKSNRLYFRNLLGNTFFSNFLPIILVLSLLVISYIYSYFILLCTNLINREFLENYFYTLRIIITIVITGTSLLLFYKKNKYLESISKLLLIILVSSVFSGLFAYFFGNNSFWILKYSIGILVGILFNLIYKNEINKKLRATDKQNTIASHFDPLISDRKSIYIGSQSGKNHTHIVIAHIKNLFTEGSDFKTVLTEVLNNNYMGERGFVKQTEMFIESLNLSHTN